MADRSLGFNIATNEDFVRAMTAMYTAGEKFSKLLDKLDGKIARVAVEMKGDKSAEAGMARVEREREKLDGKSARVKVEVDKKQLSDTINSFGMLARNMKSLALPGAVALATPTILALGQSAAVASQSMLLLPAAGVAAGIVMGTVKLGVSGLGQAFKDLAKGDMAKFGEDLKKLSPEAREFAVSVETIKPAFDRMRLDVQNQLFDGLGKKMSVLAREFLPMMNAGMGSVAGSLNNMADGIFRYIQNSNALSSVQTIFNNVKESMKELEPVGAAIVSIFVNIATVGSDFLPGLAAGLAEAAERAADFVAAARESGKLHEWISQGLSAVGLLGQIFINVGSIIHAVFASLHSDSDDFLTKIRDMTQRVADFLNSGRGQTILTDLFTNLQRLASGLMPLFGAIALAVLAMFQQLAPALPPLIKGITDVFNASGDLLGVFTQLLVAVLPPLGAALSALSPILGPVLIVITAITTAMKIYSITVAVVAAATKAWATVQAILNGTLLLNPIGLVVVALVALAAALVYAYNHSETFRRIVQAAWDGIKTAAGVAWAFLQGIFASFMAALADIGSKISTVGQFFFDLWQNWIIPAWNGIVLVIKTAVAVILTIILLPFVIFFNTVLKPVFTELWDLAKIVWAGIQLAVKIAVDVIMAIWNFVVDYLNSIFKPAQSALQSHMSAVWTAIKEAVNTVVQFLLGIWNGIVNFLVAVFSPAFNTMKNFVLLQWNMVKDGILIAWHFILDNIWNPMVTFITKTIPDGFQRGVDAVGRLWSSIKRALRDPLQAAIDIVWNHGIMSVWGAVTSLVGIPNNLHEVQLDPAASGRVVDTIPGYTPGRDPHTFYSPSAHASIALGGGESIMRPEFTAAVGKQQVNQINAVAKQGGTSAVMAYLATGGEKASDFGGFADGAAALNFARSQAGKPYIWAGVGPRGYDCSGFQSAVTNVALGQSPYSRRFSTGSFGASRGAGGFVPGINGSYAIGVTPNAGGGVGHMAGTLMGTNIESRSGAGVVIGGGARGADNGLFPWKFHLPELGGQFVGGGGGGGPSAFDILTGAWKTVTDALGKLGSIGGGDWGGAAGGFLKKSAGAIFDWVKDKAMAIVTQIGNSLGGGGLTGGIPGMVSGIANAFGWGSGAELDAINWIIQKESGGNPTAQNPHSSAYGLFQLLDGTWASTGVAKTSDPSKQILAGLNYIKNRYHDPLGAQAFWQSHGWYDLGGYLQPGMTMAINNTGSPERVLNPAETRSYNRGNDNGALLAAVQGLRAELHGLRGDVDHHGDQAAIAGELRGLRYQLATAGASVAVSSQSKRTQSELGAWS